MDEEVREVLKFLVIIGIAILVLKFVQEIAHFLINIILVSNYLFGVIGEMLAAFAISMSFLFLLMWFSGYLAGLHIYKKK